MALPDLEAAAVCGNVDSDMTDAGTARVVCSIPPNQIVVGALRNPLHFKRGRRRHGIDSLSEGVRVFRGGIVEQDPGLCTDLSAGLNLVDRQQRIGHKAGAMVLSVVGR